MAGCLSCLKFHFLNGIPCRFLWTLMGSLQKKILENPPNTLASKSSLQNLRVSLLKITTAMRIIRKKSQLWVFSGRKTFLRQNCLPSLPCIKIEQYGIICSKQVGKKGQHTKVKKKPQQKHLESNIENLKQKLPAQVHSPGCWATCSFVTIIELHKTWFVSLLEVIYRFLSL